MAMQIRLLRRLINPSTEVDWEAVYVKQLPRLYNYFRYRTGDSLLAEDLSAATFELAWRARFRYRHDLGAFSTWLFSIAHNVASDYFRKQRSELSLDECLNLTGGSGVEETTQHLDDLARLTRLLNELPEREREVVALKYGAELTNRAIAQQTGLSESNVGTLLNRVVNKLRTQWEAEQ
jgi:RNA polymerase sigma-70 factor (ECF subfamily)